MKVDSAIDDYLGALGAERGLSRNTRAAYRRDLLQYEVVLGESGVDEVDEVSPEDVAGFVSSLHQRGLAAATIARKIAAVRGMHRFLAAEGLASRDPTVLLESPSRRRSLPKALTVDEVLALLEAPDRTSPLGLRDAALLEFLYASGARVTEAVDLELIDLDLDDGVAVVTGKGNRQRVVPLGGPAVGCLRDYLEIRMDLKGDRPDPGRVFLNSRGKPLTRQGVFAIVRRQAKRAGLDAGKVSPHVLRHSAATHMVEGGADLRSIQEILGHANISTTQIYTRVTPQHLQEIYVTAHPRGR